MKRATLTTLVGLVLAGGLSAQKGYEWDQPDGLGVRYLLFSKMKPSSLQPIHDGPHAHSGYIPTDETEWVKYKGTTWGWGVCVYEFPKDPSSLKTVKGHVPAADFEEFVLHRDPTSTHYRYFAVEGEERDGEQGPYRHWEYFDAHPGIAGEDRGYPRASGKLYWADDMGLGIRHLIGEGMFTYENPSSPPPPYQRTRYLVTEKHRIKVDGPPLPVSWSLDVLHFPVSASDEKISDFASLVASSKANRDFRAQGEEQQERGSKFRWWRWFDDNRKGRPDDAKVANYHFFAASYTLDAGEVVLQVALPSDGPRLTPDLESLGRRIATSLERLTEVDLEKARKKPLRAEFVSYKVAGCHLIGDREVVMVVRHPVVTGFQPNRHQLERARRMVRSVQPAKD
jgi:hypothetical protein